MTFWLMFWLRAQKIVQAQLWFLFGLTVASMLRMNGTNGFEKWTALLKQRKQNLWMLIEETDSYRDDSDRMTSYGLCKEPLPIYEWVRGFFNLSSAPSFCACRLFMLY